MSYAINYISEKDRYVVVCLCPINRSMELRLLFETEEESIEYFNKIVAAKNLDRKKILTLIEMEKRPYTLKKSGKSRRKISLLKIWHGKN